MHDIAILIGRFQPLHNAHLALVSEALSRARHVIVVLGSAHAARSVRNPFSWQERRDMLLASLHAPEASRVRCVPVRDFYDEPVWAQAVVDSVNRAAKAFEPDASNTPSFCLVGHFKDTSSSYLQSFPGWTLHAVQRQGAIDATRLRDAWLSGTPESHWANDLPDASRNFLTRFAQTPAFGRLQNEWVALRQHHEAWAAAPYPPVLVTVDALIHTQGKVLLIRRGRAPGQGLLALPGGFIDVHEPLLASCLRELDEETHCALEPDALRAALQEVRVFAHPARSQRGRTITHVHRFALERHQGAIPPAVRADDDAASAHWMCLSELHDLEDQFFEDHFHIVDRMLGVSPVRAAEQNHLP